MSFKDVLLALTSYPEPTPASVIEKAVTIAARLNARLTAISCEVHVDVPGHLFPGKVANLPGLIAAEAAKSRQNARDLLAAFDAAAALLSKPPIPILFSH